MSTEPAPQSAPVKYKETIREQWSRWASLAENVAPGRYCTRVGSVAESGAGFFERAEEPQAKQAQVNGMPARACGGQPDGRVRRLARCHESISS